MSCDTDNIYIENLITGGGGGGNGPFVFAIVSSDIVGNSNNFTPVANMTWDLSRYLTYTSGTAVFFATVATRDLEMRLVGAISGVIGTSGTITSTGVGTFSITNPVVDDLITLEIRRTSVLDPPPNPILNSMSLEWST